MYHVATLIPYKEDDEQQIDRKRHLGNDIVIIVFKEGTQKFDPTVIKSQFNRKCRAYLVSDECSPLVVQNSFSSCRKNSATTVSTTGCRSSTRLVCRPIHLTCPIRLSSSGAMSSATFCSPSVSTAPLS